jgi:hypothetical protein
MFFVGHRPGTGCGDTPPTIPGSYTANRFSPESIGYVEKHLQYTDYCILNVAA